MADILNGEGYVTIKIYNDEARTGLVGSIAMPYTEKGGYTERWTEESFLKSTITLDTDAPQITKRPFIVGYWGSWELSWRSLSIPKATWLSVVDAIRGRKTGSAEITYYLSIVPRSDYAETNREFAVNYTGGSLEILGNTGGTAAAGTKGLALSFETTTTQTITVVDPAAVNYRVISDQIRTSLITN